MERLDRSLTSAVFTLTKLTSVYEIDTKYTLNVLKILRKYVHLSTPNDFRKKHRGWYLKVVFQVTHSNPPPAPQHITEKTRVLFS